MSGPAQPASAVGVRRRRVRLYVLLGILVLLVLHVGADMLAGRRVDSVLARLEQRVGPLTLGRLAAAEVPPGENLARLVRAATALTVPSAPPVEHALGALADARQTTSVPEVIRAFVTANQPAIDLTREFETRQKADWEADYLTGENAASLLEVRTLGNVLMASALLDLEAGRVDDAVRQVSNGLAVSASMRNEPSLITQLIRVAIVNRQLGVVQRLVANHDPSRAALEGLAARLAENRDPSPMTVGMLGEVTLINSTFAAVEAGRTDAVAGRAPSLWSTSPFRRIGRPLIRYQRAAYLERMASILESQTGPRPRLQVLPQHRPLFAGQFISGATSGLERALMTGDDHDSELAAAETAVALRRYQLGHGEYPAELGALVPQYLPAVPIDPFTGKPPAYVKGETGFTLTTQRHDPRRATMRPTPEWKVGEMGAQQKPVRR